MGAARYLIHIEQGATWKPVLTLRDTDLTGYTARMQIRATLDSDTVLVELTTGAGITIDGAAGQITLHLDDTETAALDWCDGIYDLEIVDPDGNVMRLLKGPVEVDPEVTR
jgi:hypothetical protein